MDKNEELFFKTGGTTIPYILSRSRKAKNIRIIIDTKGTRVVAPPSVDLIEIERVLRKKENWLLKHFLSYQNKKSALCSRNWESSEQVLYRGQPVEVNISEAKGHSISVAYSEGRFELRIGDSIPKAGRKDAVEETFKEWFKRAARVFFHSRIAYYCERIGVKVNTFRIREQKTRWGSCSGKGNLNLNWKLMMAPDWVIDYVIVHECCHLKHMNHSKAFWELVEVHFPQYQKARSWLKEHGHELGF